MTVIVSVKINDGLVMASDSASTFANGQIYSHANKIANLVKGLPVGIMVTGAGGIGSESVETLFKDLRRRLAGSDHDFEDWKIDPQNYTVEQIVDRTFEMFSEKAGRSDQALYMLLRVCGYSAGRPLGEVWDLHVTETVNIEAPDRSKIRVQGENNFGPLWHGETEALDRLLFGLGGNFLRVAEQFGLTYEQASDAQKKLCAGLYETLWLNAMPVEDVIALAKYLVDTTAGFVKFAVGRAKTVGGPIEIATITKHEGFRWVQRKHFYPASLNL